MRKCPAIVSPQADLHNSASVQKCMCTMSLSVTQGYCEAEEVTRAIVT